MLWNCKGVYRHVRCEESVTATDGVQNGMKEQCVNNAFGWKPMETHFP